MLQPEPNVNKEDELIQRTFLFDKLRLFWNNQPKIQNCYIKKHFTNSKTYKPTYYCLQYVYNKNYTNLSRKYPEFIAKDKSENKINNTTVKNLNKCKKNKKSKENFKNKFKSKCTKKFTHFKFLNTENCKIVKTIKLHDKNQKFRKFKYDNRGIYLVDKPNTESKNVSVLNINRTFEFEKIIKMWNERTN